MIAKNHKNQAGNVFFLVMVAVLLFGALMFTFSRGARQGTDTMTDRRADVVASDLLNYAQRLERAVSRLQQRSISESDMSFEHSGDDGDDYENTSCTVARCRIFSESGGGARYRDITSELAISGGTQIITGEWRIEGVGEDCADDRCVELTLFVNLGDNARLCGRLNQMLRITDTIETPTVLTLNVTGAPFTGAFSHNPSRVINHATLNGRTAACFGATHDDETSYIFYNVLLPR